MRVLTFLLFILLLTLAVPVYAREIGDDPNAVASPTATATPAPQVVADALNLRSGPGTSYRILGSLLGGAKPIVKGRNQTGDWLRVEYEGQSGWVSARYVSNPPGVLPVIATPTLPTSTPTPSPALEPPTPKTASPPPVHASRTVVLAPGTIYPVRAERIVGWGYEFVDASTQYDLILHRDVYGLVVHEFWGERLYGAHPHGIRITLIDAQGDGRCPGPVAPFPLIDGPPCLLEGFGDGAGSLIYVGCALAAHYYYDPQECAIAIATAGKHLTDIVLAATVTAQNTLLAGYFARTPDFSLQPFHLLGQAYREGDQWRWREPFLEVVSTR